MKVKDDTVSVTLVSKDQTNSLANNVIRLVNENSKKEVSENRCESITFK